MAGTVRAAPGPYTVSYTAAMSNPDDAERADALQPPAADGHGEPVAVASYATEGEAEIAQAKLRAFGIEAALDDQIEGGAVAVDGEPGVIVEVRAVDADDARRILTEGDEAEPQPAPGPTAAPSADPSQDRAGGSFGAIRRRKRVPPWTTASPS